MSSSSKEEVDAPHEPFFVKRELPAKMEVVDTSDSETEGSVSSGGASQNEEEVRKWDGGGDEDDESTTESSSEEEPSENEDQTDAVRSSIQGGDESEHAADDEIDDAASETSAQNEAGGVDVEKPEENEANLQIESMDDSDEHETAASVGGGNENGGEEEEEVGSQLSGTSDRPNSSKPKRKRDEEFDDDVDFDEERLEDDDYDLLEENLGIKVQRKMFKRVRRIVDNDSSSEDGNAAERNERDFIAGQLFDGADEDEGRSQLTQQSTERRVDVYGSEESGMEDEEDDFIVDDNNVSFAGRSRHRGLRDMSYEDEAALREAQDVFGCDFDYGEVGQFGSESEDSMSGDEDGGGRRRRRFPVKPAHEVFEPAQLERFGISEESDRIRQTDVPERFQRRPVPLESADAEELEEEAEWIFENYFKRDKGWSGSEERLKENIFVVLQYIRNEKYEVPYIAMYKCDEIAPYLEEEAQCWKVYEADSAFCSFSEKKAQLLKLARSVQQHQGSIVVARGTIPEDMRVLKDEYIERMADFRRLDQVTDMTVHLHFAYEQELYDMKEARGRKRNKKARDDSGAGSGDEAPMEEEADREREGAEEEPAEAAGTERRFKKSTSVSRYTLYRQAGLGQLVAALGIPVVKLGESMRDGYSRFEIQTPTRTPTDVAADYKHLGNWPTDVLALEVAKFMLAKEISKDFVVRQVVRETLFKKARLTVYPTTKGFRQIDQNHPVYSWKYLRDKPVSELKGDEFLKLTMAEDDKLLVLELGEHIAGREGPFVDELLEFCKDDSYSAVANLWNTERQAAGRMALEKYLIPELRKELRAKLVEDAKAWVAKECADKFGRIIEEAPYRIRLAEEGQEGRGWSRCCVLAVAYSEEPEAIVYACVLDEHGNVLNYTKLKHLMHKWSENKNCEMKELGRLMMTTKPHIVAVAGSSRRARSVRYELGEVLKQIKAKCTEGPTEDDDEEEDAFARFRTHFDSEIPVKIFDPEVAKLYATSNDSKLEFPDFPTALKEAISLGRKIQDPLCEVAQLCNFDKDIMALHLHPLQSQVSEEALLSQLYVQMTRSVSAVGVDINEIVFHQHKRHLLQFCPGFGPAKAQGLIQSMSARNKKLENRAQLIDTYKFGPTIFVNCAGFIKVSPHDLSDEAFTEKLDTLRIHPQLYDLAVKMCIKAVSTEDPEDDEEEEEDSILPQTAVEEVLKDPTKLESLDKEALIMELSMKGSKNPQAHVNLIYEEMYGPFRDPRPDMRFLERDEEFFLLAKETPDTFYAGKLVMATVIEIVRDRNETEIMNSQPVRVLQGMYKCSVCLRDNFTMDEAWSHIGKACPGRPLHIKLMVENEVPGELDLHNLSEKKAADATGLVNPETRVAPGQTIHCRICEIDFGKFLVKCSSRSSDLTNSEYRREKDAHYDQEREDREVARSREERQRAQKATQLYTKRLIVHPSFKNITYAESEKLMELMEQGEVIVRPSSKGTDHLTVTWKVADGVCQHVDVIERHKESAFTLGKKLIIQDEEFEDLDEIIARFINPLAANAREILNHRYYNHRFCGAEKKQVEDYLREQQQKNANKIPYVLYAAKIYPGKFVIAYLPSQNVHYEYVTVLEHGFKFRHLVFGSFEGTLKWFKEHYNEPPPLPPSVAMPQANFAFPRAPLLALPPAARSVVSTYGEGDSSRVQGGMAPLAASLARNYIQTPYTTPFSVPATPYTPSSVTPHMTPFQHSAQSTPRFPALPAPASFSLAYRARPRMAPGAHAPIRHRAVSGANAVPLASEVLGAGFRQAAESWARMQQRPRAQVYPSSIVESDVSDNQSMDTDCSSFGSGGRGPNIASGACSASAASTPHTSYTPQSMVLGSSRAGSNSPHYSD